MSDTCNSNIWRDIQQNPSFNPLDSPSPLSPPFLLSPFLGNWTFVFILWCSPSSPSSPLVPVDIQGVQIKIRDSWTTNEQHNEPKNASSHKLMRIMLINQRKSKAKALWQTKADLVNYSSSDQCESWAFKFTISHKWRN